MVKHSHYYIRTSKNETNNERAYYFDKITTAIFPSPKPVHIKNPKKILILRNDHIGDLVLTTQVFREIKKYFPDAKITVMINPIAKSIIEKNKNVDEIIPFGLFWRARNIKAFLDYLKVLKKIKREKFDIGIDVRSSLLNSFFFLFLGRVKKRVAYFNKNGGKIFLTNPILYAKQENNTKNILRLANEAMEMQSRNYWPEIIVDKQDKKEVEKFFKKNKIKKFICMIPGTTTPAKAWPVENYNKLIKKINKKYPKHKILLVGGGGDADKINYLKKNNKNCIPVINFNLRLAAILFKKADVTIGCDGAAKEMVWVVKGNLIDLEGPVNFNVHASLGGKNVKVLKHDTPCYPCNWSAPCKRPCGYWCMELITVNEVMKAIEDFIAEKKKKKKMMDKKRNVIMILLDGARYDLLKDFPTFKKIVGQGSFFSKTITYAPYTLAAMNAIFSGTYGFRTGVDSYYNPYKFDKKRFETLTTILKKAGYRTYGDLLSDIIVPLQGFEDFKVHNELKDNLGERHCKLLNKMSKGKKPFFLYLHYSNIHTGLLKNVLKKYNNFSKEYFNQKEKNLENYMGYLKNAETYLNKVMNKIRKLGLLKDSLVIIQSDHGCSVGDKIGERAYGAFCYDYTVRSFVTFLQKDLFPEKEFNKMVRSIDVLPTILEALRIKCPKNIDGVSLGKIIKGKKDFRREAFIETGNPCKNSAPPKNPNVKAIRNEGWKFIINFWDNNSKELYNLEKDPEEKENLVGKEGKMCGIMGKKLNNYLKEELKEKLNRKPKKT